MSHQRIIVFIYKVFVGLLLKIHSLRSGIYIKRHAECQVSSHIFLFLYGLHFDVLRKGSWHLNLQLSSRLGVWEFVCEGRWISYFPSPTPAV